MLRQSGRKSVMKAVLFIVLAIFITSAYAAEKTVTLGGGFWKKAKGAAVIKDAAGGQKELTIDAKGLKPNGVYTVWLVNMKPAMEMSGLGAGDYSFKSDSKGNGRYSATIPGAELEKWQMLIIAYHPDGDPKNMKRHKDALKGELK